MIKDFWNKLKGRLHRRSRSATPSPGSAVEQLLLEPSADERAALISIARSYLLHLHEERRSELRWQRMRRAVLVFLMLSGAAGFWWQALKSADADLVFWRKERPAVGIVELRGSIAADGPVSADSAIAALTRAAKDKSVRTIALYIDSPGGQPAEAERIANAIAQLRKSYNKPIVAVGGNVVASAAYLVALEADRIVVPSHALVGSIGAVIPSWDVSRLLKRLDIEHRSYASGPYKAMLSPFETQTQQAQQKAQALVNEMAEIFAQRVATKRGAQLKRDVRELATGEVWSGRDALALGLADAAGTLETVLTEDENLEIKRFGGSRAGGVLQFLRAELLSRLYGG